MAFSSTWAPTLVTIDPMLPFIYTPHNHSQFCMPSSVYWHDLQQTLTLGHMLGLVFTEQYPQKMALSVWDKVITSHSWPAGHWGTSGCVAYRGWQNCGPRWTASGINCAVYINPCHSGYILEHTYLYFWSILDIWAVQVFKIFPHGRQGMFAMHIQNHHCWWPGDTRRIAYFHWNH